MTEAPYKNPNHIMTKSIEISAAELIFAGFEGYNNAFKEVTKCAKNHFESQDWYASQRDQAKRIELYEEWVWKVVDSLKTLLSDSSTDKNTWNKIKVAFNEVTKDFCDVEFTKTYFNSISRRIFKTEGINPEVEYIAIDLKPLQNITKTVPTICFRSGKDDLQSIVVDVLNNYQFDTHYADINHTAEFISHQIQHQFLLQHPERDFHHIEVLQPIFYQNTRAYIVGKLVFNDLSTPFAIALMNTEVGLKADAVVLTPNDMSVLFGYTRSYFHVDLETVADMVVYLRELMPHKSVAELFTVLGRAKQGKTERYRHLMTHLEHSSDKFEIAAGDAGLVMAVFTLPSYNMVFKLIRDKFGYPKTATREEVLARYQLVFKHDRAGRLIDAQEFRHLVFDLKRFNQELLDELKNTCAESIEIKGNQLVIKHCYIERRITPLNLYLQDNTGYLANKVLIDFGQCIKDLAANNIFPGDMLLKNFGVTRNERVIFYDYDELCLLQECNFRKMPQAQTYDQMMSGDAWYYVAENDVFPEQFTQFIGLEGEMLATFQKHHNDVMDYQFWNNLKEKHKDGALIEFLPYREELTNFVIPADA